MCLTYLKIDVRERELIHLVQKIISTTSKFNNIQLKVAPMTLGDISFEIETDPNIYSETLIIERKSISDLSASIKDGRYAEQSFRLSGADHPNHNIVYLIEGCILTPPKKSFKYNKYSSKVKPNRGSIADGVCVFGPIGEPPADCPHIPVAPSIPLSSEQTMIYSSLFTLNYNKGFSVIRTDSLNETAIFICNSYDKWVRGLSTGSEPYYKICEKSSSMSETTNIPQQSYIDVVKRVKKDNITPDNIGELLLCQFPGISTASSSAIMQKFTTFTNLIHEVERNPSTAFDDIYIISDKGQKRKISKTIKTTILSYLQICM
jgi:ERCC4-type nuclease